MATCIEETLLQVATLEMVKQWDPFAAGWLPALDEMESLPSSPIHVVGSVCAPLLNIGSAFEGWHCRPGGPVQVYSLF